MKENGGLSDLDISRAYGHGQTEADLTAPRWARAAMGSNPVSFISFFFLLLFSPSRCWRVGFSSGDDGSFRRLVDHDSDRCGCEGCSENVLIGKALARWAPWQGFCVAATDVISAKLRQGKDKALAATCLPWQTSVTAIRGRNLFLLFKQTPVGSSISQSATPLIGDKMALLCC